MPVFFIIVIIFIIWLFYEKNKSNKIMKQNTESFWETEHQADLTRKVDLSTLEYLVISLDELPFLDTDDSTLLEYQNLVKALSAEKIINLSAFSNTELKFKYGRANLTFLSSYDQNYTNLVSTLYRWGNYLYAHNYIAESKRVFEYGLKCNSDIKGMYLDLAKIYKEEGYFVGIDQLIDRVTKLDSQRTESILAALQQIKNF